MQQQPHISQISFESFKSLYTQSFEAALSKKPADVQEKIRTGQESLYTTTRVEIPSHLVAGAKEGSFFHITLFFHKGLELEKLFQFWKTIFAKQWSGEFIIEESTPVQQFGPRQTRPGHFEGWLYETHREVFMEGLEMGTVFSEMPKEQQKEEMLGYHFTPHISGFTEPGRIVIPLTGLKIQLKFLGPVDPFVEFTI